LILGGYLLFSTFPIALVVAYNLTSNDVIKLLIWLAVCLVFGTVISLVSSAMIEKRITRLGNLGFFAQNREISSSVFKPLLRLPLWTKIDFETGPYRICNLLNIPNILNWKNSSFDSKS
jgi:hypothetical protein